MPTLNTNADQAAFEEHEQKQKRCARWLKDQAKTVRKFTIGAALAGLLNGCGAIAQAALLAQLLHGLIIEHLPWQHLSTPLLLFVAVMLLRVGSVYTLQRCGFEAAAHLKQQLRERLWLKLATLGPAYAKQRQSGALAALGIEQIDALEGYFARYLPQQYIVGVLPLLMIIVILPVNWVVALIFMVTGPLLVIFMALVGMGAAAASRQQFIALARMGSYFLDRLQGLSTLQLFGQAQREIAAVARVSDDFRVTTMRVLRIAFLSSAVLEFFSAVAVALVAVYVGLGLLGLISFGPAAHISLREALFALLLAPEFFLPLRQLAMHYHDRAAALGAAQDLIDIFEMPEELSSSAVVTAPTDGAWLSMRGVSKNYGQKVALARCDLDIAISDKIALIGPSGAGKSTLLNLLLGFEQPSSGQILLNGRVLDRTEALRQIAWVGQGVSLFYGSIRDNIALPDPDADLAEIERAAEAAGVAEFSRRLPDGLNTLVGERGYGLSGGQIQRIALARAFLKHAPLVLLDEPTAHLDPANRVRLMDVIERLFDERTLIIATHDPEVIQRMPRRLELQNGVLIDEVS